MKIRGYLPLYIVIAGLLVVGGCKTKYYDLELLPEGDTMHRTLVVEGDEDALAALEEIYGHPPELIIGETASGKPTSRYKFEGAFKSVTPGDIGGSGFLLQCESNMGSSSVYSEQFRGDIDLAASLHRQEVAFNRLFDIFLLWLESEFADAPDFSELHKAVDENLRVDVWNLGLYLSTFSSIGNALDTSGGDNGDALLQQIGMRTLHFLVARGYFEVKDLPRITAAVSYFDADSTDLAIYYARALANIMGVPKDEPLPESLASIARDPEAYADSVDAFFDTDEVDALATDAFSARFRFAWEGGEFLRANMEVANEPYVTNGEWDAQGVLKWRKPLPQVDTTTYDLPVLIYAFWSDPDSVFQNEHFGREVLIEESLGEYCHWHLALTEIKSQQWDEFVDSLEPDENLVQRLERFQFKGEPDRPAGVTYNKNIRSGIALSIIGDVVSELTKSQD